MTPPVECQDHTSSLRTDLAVSQASRSRCVDLSWVIVHGAPTVLSTVVPLLRPVG